jgi:hypothetical protein
VLKGYESSDASENPEDRARVRYEMRFPSIFTRLLRMKLVQCCTEDLVGAPSSLAVVRLLFRGG